MLRLLASHSHHLLSAAVVVCLALAVRGPAAAQDADGGPVLAIRSLELNDGIDVSEFDRFVRTTFNPGWRGIIPGMAVSVMKADRGEQKGSYVLVFHFDSVRTRNAYFPQEGSEGTEAFEGYVKQARDLDAKLMNYVETVGPYTDYVALQ